MKKALVLGGGVGGVVASTVLKKILRDNIDVTVVDKSKDHFFYAALPLLLLGRRKPEDFTRKLSLLEDKGIEFLQAEVENLLLPKKLVQTNKGTLAYDYLIIALGVEYHPETVPGFDRHVYNAYQVSDMARLQTRLSTFEKGSIVLFVSSLPYKCPPAPYEIVFLLDEYFRKKGLRNKINLTLVTPDITPEPLAPPPVGQRVRKMLVQKGIELRTEAKILEVKPGKLLLDHGAEIQGDLFLGVPPHWTPSCLRVPALVDGDGWVIVDQHTLKTAYPDVYAVGDATGIRLPVIGALAPKAGIFAHYQAEVVARNIACIEKGQKPTFRYTGKGTCMINTGFGRASYSTVHYYNQPAPYITLHKPRAAAYWGKIAFEKYWLNFWI